MMAFLRRKDIEESFNYFDNGRKLKLNREEIICSIISLFGMPPSKVNSISYKLFFFFKIKMVAP